MVERECEIQERLIQFHARSSGRWKFRLLRNEIHARRLTPGRPLLIIPQALAIRYQKTDAICVSSVLASVFVRSYFAPLRGNHVDHDPPDLLCCLFLLWSRYRRKPNVASNRAFVIKWFILKEIPQSVGGCEDFRFNFIAKVFRHTLYFTLHFLRSMSIELRVYFVMQLLIYRVDYSIFFQFQKEIE